MAAEPAGPLTMLALALVVIPLGIVTSMTLDRLAQPRGAGIVRPLPMVAIHIGLLVCIWSLVWLISGRPVFALAFTLAGQYLVIAVSNAKFRALREPFVFSDFSLFSQAFRFPRLYLPFLGVARAAAAGLGLAGAVGIGMFLEHPWPAGLTPSAAMLGCGLALLLIGTRLASTTTMDPIADLAAIGLFPSLWLYWQAEHAPLPTPPERPWLEQVPALSTNLDDTKLPDLVVVQSESFFDARRLYPGVQSDLFGHFDALSAQALAHGRLQVPAWGANTMRTEFAVLTGIPEATLGVHRFNPYRRFAESGPLALPQQLRRLGYHTVCIHPHTAGFFGRDRVFPRLGFDTFLDIAAFAEATRIGPYVADAAVTAKIAEVLGSARVPTFVFAITMENHGPLHLEQVNPEDVGRLYQNPPPPGWEDLTVYLRHLANADQMLRDLAELLKPRPRPGLLCWFGDHVPSLPKVYRDLAFTDASTDYLIWSGARDGLPAVDIDAYQLPEVLLTALVKAARTTGAATGRA